MLTELNNLCTLPMKIVLKWTPKTSNKMKQNRCTASDKAAIINNQMTIGPVNAHLISWPSKAQNIQNLENIW